LSIAPILDALEKAHDARAETRDFALPDALAINDKHPIVVAPTEKLIVKFVLINRARRAAAIQLTLPIKVNGFKKLRRKNNGGA
jgi:hypothetical protein